MNVRGVDGGVAPVGPDSLRHTPPVVAQGLLEGTRSTVDPPATLADSSCNAQRLGVCRQVEPLPPHIADRVENLECVVVLRIVGGIRVLRCPEGELLAQLDCDEGVEASIVTNVIREAAGGFEALLPRQALRNLEGLIGVEVFAAAYVVGLLDVTFE